jgi:ribosomal protein S18 acetylase RimI-like enzyme
VEPHRLLAQHLDELPAVWLGVTRERLEEILPRHARREGFRFLAARATDGVLAGIAYGYLGAPGQWWHDRVAAALGPDRAGRWLPPGHFEFVELHVSPQLRRRGIGGRLHDALLGGLASPTAVLSTQKENEAAIALYERRGWQIVGEVEFGPAYPPYHVMARELAGRAPT